MKNVNWDWRHNNNDDGDNNNNIVQNKIVLTTVHMWILGKEWGTTQ